MEKGEYAMSKKNYSYILKLEAKKNVKGMIKALSNRKDRFLSIQAAGALGRTGDPRAVKPLILALEEREEAVSKAAARALPQIGASAVDPLIATVKQKKWVRDDAADALRKVSDPSAVKPLIAALSERRGL